MTNREFFEAIVNGTINDEIQAHAAEAIAKLDKTLEARRNKVSKKAMENQPLVDALVAALTAEPQTASDLKDVIEASVQKTSALLRAAVAQGKAVARDIPVKGRGIQKGYTIAE